MHIILISKQFESRLHAPCPFVFLMFQCIFLFFLCFHGCPCSVWKFPGQRLNLSDSYGIARSFNLLHQARDWTLASAVTHATAVIFLTHCTVVGTPSVCFLRARIFSYSALIKFREFNITYNILIFCFLLKKIFFFHLHLQHSEVLRLELQQWQHQILNC